MKHHVLNPASPSKPYQHWHTTADGVRIAGEETARERSQRHSTEKRP